MHLGCRNIRSAGRNSGSVEITLPVDLAILEGISCRLYLRDGLDPEIILQPDLRAVMPLFEKLWALLRVGLEDVDEIGDFTEADFCFGLFLPAKLGTQPPLAYADALLLHRSLGDGNETSPHALEAFARIIESMAAVAARRLGLANDFVAAFANQAAYLVSGEAIGARDAFARSLAAQQPGLSQDVGWCRETPLSKEAWRRAKVALAQVYGQFLSWGNDPTAFAKDRLLWYRAHRFESHAGSAPMRAAGASQEL
jgi:hypothetical protein